MSRPASTLALIRTLFVAAIVSLGLSGCSFVELFYDSNVSKDPRFKGVLGHEIHTRKKLRLYAPNARQPDRQRQYYDLTDSIGGSEILIAVVPAGHPVKFTQVLRQNLMGDGKEDLYGEITLKGTTYPIKSSLGLTSRPDDWREMYQMFVIKE